MEGGSSAMAGLGGRGVVGVDEEGDVFAGGIGIGHGTGNWDEEKDGATNTYV